MNILVKPKYSKKTGETILKQTAGLFWSKKDDKFLKEGRRQIEKRLKKNASL